jgi:hypothetical protein
MEDEESKIFWEKTVGQIEYGKEKMKFINEMMIDFRFETNNIIPLEINILIDPSNDGIVSISDYLTFLKLFGPFKKCFQNVDLILSYEWFWGTLNTYECELILKNEPIGTYLLRFDESRPGKN